MNDHDDVERLRELVVDERARRLYAEKQLLAERRRTETLRSRPEGRQETPRKTLNRVRGLLGRLRRSRGEALMAPPKEVEGSSAAPSVALPPYQPTLRIAAWGAPDWLCQAADVVELTRDQSSLAGADLVFVGGTGALTVLSDWLTLPARQPLVLWDWGGGEVVDWAQYLIDRDLVVGTRQLGAAAKHLVPWVVADPREISADAVVSGASKAAIANVETPLSEIVSRALMRSPMEWGGPKVPPELAGLVVGDSADTRKAGVVSRLVAAERYSPAAAIEHIADQVGIRLPSVAPSVGILLVTRWPDRLAKALEQISRLRYPHYEVVVGLHGTGPTNEARARLASSSIEGRVRFLDFDEELSLGECLNRSAEATGASVLAKFDDDDRYGRWYLDEAVDDLITNGAELIGKATQFVYLSQSDQLLLYQPGKEHSEVPYVNGPTFVMPRHTWEQVRFPHRRSRVDSIFVRGLKAMGGTIRSTSRYEFLLGRQARGHTWEASEERFLASSNVVGKGSDDSEVWLPELGV